MCVMYLLHLRSGSCNDAKLSSGQILKCHGHCSRAEIGTGSTSCAMAAINAILLRRICSLSPRERTWVCVQVSLTQGNQMLAIWGCHLSGGDQHAWCTGSCCDLNFRKIIVPQCCVLVYCRVAGCSKCCLVSLSTLFFLDGEGLRMG